MNPYLESYRKRALDLVLTVPLCVVASLPLLLTGLMVVVLMGKPVVFRQERAGHGGRSFLVLKTRTMVTATTLHRADAERLTPVGRLLRATSLDELPQLWNVLRGDMSLVGPRPLPVRYVERYSPEQRLRLAARPGLTGLAVVKGRNALSWEEKFAWDVEYVRTASLRMDLMILLKTVPALLRVKATAAEGHATMPEFMGSN